MEHLIGIKAKGDCVESVPGVLGPVRCYFGSVESQGRGNLHCHLLLWLANTPDNVAMSELLREDVFRERLQQYIKNTVSADVDGFLPENANRRYDHPHPVFLTTEPSFSFVSD